MEERNRQLEETLKETGETLIWENVPEKFESVDKTNKTHYIISCILIVLIAAAVSVSYYIKMSGGVIGLYVIVWLLAAIIMFSTLSIPAKVRKCGYYMTDKRVIVFTNSDDMRVIPFKSVKEYRFMKDEDGHTTLLVGKNAVNLPASKWRALSLDPVDADESTGTILKAGVYAIPNVDEFRKIFTDRVKL